MKRPCIITFVNTFSYYKLLDSSCPLDKIDCIFADGGLQVLLHNFFHKNKINRASFDFSSLADELFNYVIGNNLLAAFIGSAENEIKAAVSNLKEKYPALQIQYSRNGYFENNDERNKLLDILRSEHIDVVIIGMGTPAQEELAIFLKENNLNAWIFTCGGFLSQTAKSVDYYKDAVKKTNLRWLQRAVEYKHIRRRLLIDYPKNIARYLRDHIVLLFKYK